MSGGASGGTPLPGTMPIDQVAKTRADVIAGPARVIDGDTLEIDNDRIRLAGIDAPERHQQCLDPNGRPYACGLQATDATKAMALGTIICAVSGPDRYRRAVATCASGGLNLNRALGLAGLALNEPRYSPDYRAEEADAKDHRRGIHAGRFVTPWEWRRGERVPVVIGIDHGVEAEQAPLVTTRGPFAIKHGVMHDDTRTVVPIDTTETGSWNNTSLHLLAHSPTVAFGVASRDRSLEA